jgi:hypothetical protein
LPRFAAVIQGHWFFPSLSLWCRLEQAAAQKPRMAVAGAPFMQREQGKLALLARRPQRMGTVAARHAAQSGNAATEVGLDLAFGGFELAGIFGLQVERSLARRSIGP